MLKAELTIHSKRNVNKNYLEILNVISIQLLPVTIITQDICVSKHTHRMLLERSFTACIFLLMADFKEKMLEFSSTSNQHKSVRKQHNGLAV